MNDVLKDRLSALDELAIKALRLLFDEQIDKQFPKVEDEDNELLGAKFRAYEEAKKIIDGAFQELITLNIRKSNAKGFNKEL